MQHFLSPSSPFLLLEMEIEKEGFISSSMVGISWVHLQQEQSQDWRESWI